MFTRIFGALAVVLLIVCGFLGWRASAAGSRADAAESRAQAAEGQVRALREAQAREAVAYDATTVARDSAAKRQPIQEARAAKVKSYADSAADACLPDLRIVSELRQGEDRVRRTANRLRGNGQPKSAPADDPDD